MPKPTIGQSDWGNTLNAHLDAIEADVATRATSASVAAKQDSATLDSAVTTHANNPASALRASLSATIGSELGTSGTPARVAADARYVKQDDIFLVAAATNNAANDLPAINAQIARANASKGVVQLRQGTYFIDGPLTALESGVEIRGMGPHATVIRSSSTTADLITASGKSLVGVRDLQLESLVTRTAGSGIAFTNVSGYVIDNVRFVDTYNAATLDTCDSGWLSRIKVAHGTGVFNRGFYFLNCVSTHADRWMINGGGTILGAGKAWLHVDSGCDTFAGTDLEIVPGAGGSGVCLLLSHSLSPSSFAPRWIKLTNFLFEGSDGASAGADGIQISDATSAYFTNGYAVTCSTGVNITGGKDIRFSQTQIMNNWLRGVVLNSSTTAKDIVFESCTFDSNSQGATGNVEHAGIFGVSQGVRFRDCYFGQGVLSRTNKPSYAIVNSVAASQDTQVTGCRFAAADYTTGIIGGTLPTQLRMRDNNGLNPVAITAPAVPATTVAYTNNFGVDAMVHVAGGTVSAVAVNGVTTGATSGAFRVPYRGTITLTYTAAPTWVWIGE